MPPLNGAASGAKRSRRLVVGLTALPIGALACVLLTLAAGISPRRLRPVAGFLGVAVAVSVCFWVEKRMTFRRARRQRNTEIPWDVRLTRPLWMSLSYPLFGLWAGSIVGTVVAALGFPGVGVGCLLTLVGFLGIPSFMDFGMSPRGLTFEPDGLRLHIRGGSFVVPWTTIARVEGIGPEHFQMTTIYLRDTDNLIGSAAPNTARVRAHVETFVRTAQAPDRKLLFTPWTAGMDGATLVRAIGAAIGGKLGQVN